MESYEEKEGFIKASLRRLWWTYILIGGMLIGYYLGVNQFQKEAVEIGLAGHNYKTGSWEWNEDEVQSKIKSEAINQACKALGSKSANDPKCILVGF